GLLTAALVPTMPHSVRMAVQMPPFGDQLAVAAGAAWLLLSGSAPPLPRRLAPAAALVTALTREQWLVTGAVARPVLGLVGGSDSPRLLHGGLPFLLAAGVGAAHDERRLAPAVLAGLALWRPLTRPEPSAAGYERFHLPYMHGLLGRRVRDAAWRVAAGVLAGGTLTVIGRRAPPGELPSRRR
ncbi:MAG TPA: hypothetical protein VD813_06625, partial [Pseudonocardia sp.]|nr:hypothetical protein [Pseudonocardia sp.]